MLKKICLYMYICMIAVLGTVGASEVLLEAKGAYFLSESSKFDKIYSGGGIYGAELSYQVWRNCYAWGSVDYFFKSGKSLGCAVSTKISMVPIGVGAKMFVQTPLEFLQLYAGVGIAGNVIRIRDHSPYVSNTISRFKVGPLAKVGAIIDRDGFFIDVFTNYFHSSSSMHIGGWTFGAGIGKRF